MLFLEYVNITRAAIPPLIPDMARGCQGILLISRPPSDHKAPASNKSAIAFCLFNLESIKSNKKPQIYGAFYK